MGRMYKLKQAALASASVQTPGIAEKSARSDPAAAAADLRLIQLTEHRKQLKALQSVEKKVALKAQILPEYSDWIEGLLEKPNNLTAGEANDVLTTFMVWSFDIGAFDAGLQIAGVVLAKDIPLPSQFDRTPGCLIAEMVAEAAMDAVKQDKGFDRTHLHMADSLTDDCDMPDEVRAKLHKASAQLIDREAKLLEDDGGKAADGKAGEYRSLLEAGLKAAQRATTLNSKAGVVKLTQRFERQLKKLSDDSGSAPKD